MTMRKIAIDGHTLWLGEHPQLGLVIYDRSIATEGIGETWVRLYKAQEAATGVFIRGVIRGELSSPSAKRMIDEKASISRYIAAKMKTEETRRDKRNAHCYSCTDEINTLDFAICLTCGWIKCHCGACGCGYVRKSWREGVPQYD